MVTLRPAAPQFAAVVRHIDAAVRLAPLLCGELLRRRVVLARASHIVAAQPFADCGRAEPPAAGAGRQRQDSRHDERAQHGRERLRAGSSVRGRHAIRTLAVSDSLLGASAARSIRARWRRLARRLIETSRGCRSFVRVAGMAPASVFTSDIRERVDVVDTGGARDSVSRNERGRQQWPVGLPARKLSFPAIVATDPQTRGGVRGNPCRWCDLKVCCY